MKKIRLLPLLPLLLFLALASCQKDKDNPVPQPEPEVPGSEPEEKAFTFNFRFDPPADKSPDYELVVSQKDGKVLLDTVILAKTSHTLTVKSVDTVFDVTTIYLDPEPNRYFIETYVQVNPNNWLIRGGGVDYVRGEREESTIHYINVPEIEYTRVFRPIEFNSKQDRFYNSYRVNLYKGTLDIEYDRLLPTDLTYLLLYETEQYIFAEAPSAETHVDFSKAEKAVRRRYEKPEGVRMSFSELTGYAKSGDYSNPMVLFRSFGSSADYDLLYPPTVIEEFYSFLVFSDTQGNKYHYTSLGPTVPTEINLLSKPDFTIINSDVNDVKVSFGEDRPSTYALTITSENDYLKAYWEVCLSPEETAIKPIDFLENLNTKLLEERDFSGFILSNIKSRKTKDFTHQSLYDYLHGPERGKKLEQRQYREITKSFL